MLIWLVCPHGWGCHCFCNGVDVVVDVVVGCLVLAVSGGVVAFVIGVDIVVVALVWCWSFGC